MYKVYIGYTDYDSPYRIDGEVKEFESVTEAKEYCLSKSSRRDKYSIEKVYKDGKEIDYRLQSSFEKLGLEGMKQSLIDQLEKHMLKVVSVNNFEELGSLKTLYLYT
ncbi:MAG: hypothetical protein RR959_08675 [Erysipelotrichaceae bacterium]